MTFDPVILSTLALVAAPLLGFLGILIGGVMSRKSARENNDTDRYESETTRFTAIVAGFESRVKALETQVAELTAEKARQSAELIEKTARLADALEENATLRRSLRAYSRFANKLLRLIRQHLPELEDRLLAPDPEDAEFIGVFDPEHPEQG